MGRFDEQGVKDTLEDFHREDGSEKADWNHTISTLWYTYYHKLLSANSLGQEKER